MKKVLFFLSCLFVVSPLLATNKKASVFVDNFSFNDGCIISDGELKILHDRIIGNVVSSRKYEVVEREKLANVQKELKLVDAGLTEGESPESNKLKAAGYCTPVLFSCLRFRCQ